MAHYISSHLCDKVWWCQLQGTQWDIHQNLVANTRMQGSATVSGQWSAAFGRWIAPSRLKDQRLGKGSVLVG